MSTVKSLVFCIGEVGVSFFYFYFLNLLAYGARFFVDSSGTLSDFDLGIIIFWIIHLFGLLLLVQINSRIFPSVKRLSTIVISSAPLLLMIILMGAINLPVFFPITHPWMFKDLKDVPFPLREVDPTLGWNTYENTAHKFSFKYPPQYKIEEREDNFWNFKNMWGIYLTDPSVKLPGFEENTTEDRTVFDLSLAGYFSDDNNVSPKVKVNIGNNQFLYYMPPDGMYSIYNYEIKNIFLSTTEENAHLVDPVFSQILSTFEFADTSSPKMDQISGWNIYENTTPKFSFKYPKDFTNKTISKDVSGYEDTKLYAGNNQFLIDLNVSKCSDCLKTSNTKDFKLLNDEEKQIGSYIAYLDKYVSAGGWFEAAATIPMEQYVIRIRLFPEGNTPEETEAKSEETIQMLDKILATFNFPKSLNQVNSNSIASYQNNPSKKADSIQEILYQVKNIFTENAEKYNATTGSSSEDSVWWITNDNFNIINPDSSSVYLSVPCRHISNLEPKVEEIKHYFSPKIKEQFLHNGFVINRLNTSDSYTDNQFYDYIEAYEKNNFKCTLVVSPDCGGFFTTDLVLTTRVVCTDQLDKNLAIQKPIIEDLNLKDGESINYIKSSGNFVYLSIRGRGTGGYYIIAEKINNGWVAIMKGQELPDCSWVKNKKIPFDIVESCNQDDKVVPNPNTNL